MIRAFRPNRPVMTLSEVATEAGLARPTARRILLTLEELGYARADDNGFALTPRIMELGVAYVRSMGLWEIARPHMEWLVARTHQSSSIAQLDGSDIVYVARVAVPKIVTLRVDIGTRFPAAATSLGKVLLAALHPAELTKVLAEPGRSGVQPSASPCEEELTAALREVRAKGWALTDQQLAPAHPLGGRAAARRVRPDHRGAQRQRPRRGDLAGDPGRGLPPAAAAGRRRDQCRLGAARVGAVRHGGLSDLTGESGTSETGSSGQPSA